MVPIGLTYTCAPKPHGANVKLDLRVIRYLHALAEHGTFSRAAEALGVKQPTLSEAISELEKEIGLPLFIRGARKVEPTELGHVFLGQSRRVIGDVADLEREVLLLKGLKSGALNVVLSSYAAAHLARPFVRQFVSAHPRVQLRIQVFSSPNEGRRALVERACDFAIGDSGHFEGEPLLALEERLPPLVGYVVVRAKHPLAMRRPVSLSDVMDYPFIQVTRFPHRVLNALLAHRVRKPGQAARSVPFPAIDLPSVREAVDAVMDTDAFMLASLSMVKRELEQGAVVPLLTTPWMHSDWGIFRLGARSLDPLATAAIADLRRIFSAVQEEEGRLAKRFLSLT